MSDVESSADTGPPALLLELQDAINGHDIERVVACFAEDYRNETPVHPARSFVGAQQVRGNWTQILGGLPDLEAQLVRYARHGDEVWAEWEWNGTRPDKTPFAMRGVTILGQGANGTAVWSRFYMEPVDQAETDVTAAVRDVVGRAS